MIRNKDREKRRLNFEIGTKGNFAERLFSLKTNESNQERRKHFLVKTQKRVIQKNDILTLQRKNFF